MSNPFKKGLKAETKGGRDVDLHAKLYAKIKGTFPLDRIKKMHEGYIDDRTPYVVGKIERGEGMEILAIRLRSALYTFTYSIREEEGKIELIQYEENVEKRGGEIEFFQEYSTNPRVCKKHTEDLYEYELLEFAGSDTGSGDVAPFRKYAQPEGQEEEYAKATGLPIIKEDSRDRKSALQFPLHLQPGELDRVEDDLRQLIKRMDSNAKHPYYPYIKLRKEGMGEETKRLIMLYTTYEAYKSKKRPIMIYMEGIDSRGREDGMFRLLENGEYVDNKTFSNGKYDTITYEEIMELLAKEEIYEPFSERVDSASEGKREIPQWVFSIYDSIMEKMRNGEMR